MLAGETPRPTSTRYLIESSASSRFCLHLPAHTLCRPCKTAGRWLIPAWLRRQLHSHYRCPCTACSPDLVALTTLHKCAGRSRTLAGGEPPAQAAPHVTTQAPQTTTHTITFFANGIFTVDNGERGCTIASMAYLYWHVFEAGGGPPVVCFFDLSGAIPLGCAVLGVEGSATVLLEYIARFESYAAVPQASAAWRR